jgi:hypothetical protein
MPGTAKPVRLSTAFVFVLMTIVRETFATWGQFNSGLSTRICVTECLQWCVRNLTPLLQLTKLLSNSIQQSLSEEAGQEIPPLQNQRVHHRAHSSLHWSQS